MKCIWPTPAFCVGTQRNLYSTDWRRGLASGKTQILGLASGVTQILALGNAKIYQHVGIANAKFWHRGHCPLPTTDARYFASQWNIGLTQEKRLAGPYIYINSDERLAWSLTQEKRLAGPYIYINSDERLAWSLTQEKRLAVPFIYKLTRRTCMVSNTGEKTCRTLYINSHERFPWSLTEEKRLAGPYT